MAPMFIPWIPGLARSRGRPGMTRSPTWPPSTAKRWMRCIFVCVWIAGTALVLISAVIPWAVFTRYVLNSAASWPEADGGSADHRVDVLGTAACHRAQLHMNVSFFAAMLPPRWRRWVDLLVELLVGAMALFMVVYGAKLVEATWLNSIDEFPELSVGVTYLPIPLGGVALLLFVIERVTHRRAARSFCRARKPHCANRSSWPPAGSGSDRWTSPFFSVTMFSVLLIGVPIAYSLGLGAYRRLLVDRHSARSGDAANLRRGQQGRDADHSVLRAGRRHHGGRRHGAAHGRASPTSWSASPACAAGCRRSMCWRPRF